MNPTGKTGKTGKTLDVRMSPEERKVVGEVGH